MTGLQSAEGIAVSGGDLFVADTYQRHDRRVHGIPGHDGQLPRSFRGRMTFVVAFRGATFSRDFNGTVAEYNATTGAVINASLVTG